MLADQRCSYHCNIAIFWHLELFGSMFMSLRYTGEELYKQGPSTVTVVHFIYGIWLGMLNPLLQTVFHVWGGFWFLFSALLYYIYLASFVGLSSKYIPFVYNNRYNQFFFLLKIDKSQCNKFVSDYFYKYSNINDFCLILSCQSLNKKNKK